MCALFFSPHKHSKVQEVDESGEIFGEHREKYRFNVIATTFNDWNQLNAMFGEMDWANGSSKVKPNRQLLIVVSTAVRARVCVYITYVYERGGCVDAFICFQSVFAPYNLTKMQLRIVKLFNSKSKHIASNQCECLQLENKRRIAINCTSQLALIWYDKSWIEFRWRGIMRSTNSNRAYGIHAKRECLHGK